MNDKDWAWEAYRKALDSAPSGSIEQIRIVAAGPAAYMPGVSAWNPTGQINLNVTAIKPYDWHDYWGIPKDSAEDDD